MILPKDIKTRHKIRDFRILSLFAQDGISQTEIAKQFGTTSQNISRIIHKHKEILAIDRDFEKLKRMNKLNRMLSNTTDFLADKRDATDIIKEMRAECEGDRSGNGDTKTIVNVYIPDRKPIENSNRLAATSTPGNISSE